jgi:hypothetical protein
VLLGRRAATFLCRLELLLRLEQIAGDEARARKAEATSVEMVLDVSLAACGNGRVVHGQSLGGGGVMPRSVQAGAASRAGAVGWMVAAVEMGIEGVATDGTRGCGRGDGDCWAWPI